MPSFKYQQNDVIGRGSLMTLAGTNTCLGYIFMHEGIAFTPEGSVEGVTKEHADAHNKALSQGEIQGLDQNCQVGQGNWFYWNPEAREVKTWGGELVSNDVTVSGSSVTLRRNGKVLRGRIKQDGDAIFFKRVK